MLAVLDSDMPNAAANAIVRLRMPGMGLPVDSTPSLSLATEKAALRKKHRAGRAEHVASLPQRLRALMLNRPPAPVAGMMPEGLTIGLYAPLRDEAPAFGWARWLSENDRHVALPWFASRESPMEFRRWANPFDEEQLTIGPWGALQPLPESEPVVPAIVIVPLLAFTADGHRLGQGGGHYDRWLDANPDVPAIGLAWDCQLADTLPIEAHDRILDAVVTPTRIYEGAI